MQACLPGNDVVLVSGSMRWRGAMYPADTWEVGTLTVDCLFKDGVL